MWGCTSATKMSANSLENENDKNEKQESEIVDTIDYSIKHPLQNCWTLWYYENDRTNSWEKNQKEIASFDTVEDFWSLYNHIKLASDLRQGCDYSLFKKGIRPMWEDDANIRGGRWLINLDKKQRGCDLDRFWLDVLSTTAEQLRLRKKGSQPGITDFNETWQLCRGDETGNKIYGFLSNCPVILCLIGEAFENSDEVCGAVVNVRGKGDKIGVWTSDAMHSGSILEIGRKLKERLRIAQKVTIGYQVHKDTMDKAGSATKNSYTI